jgi:hypothetical protein
VKEVEKILQGLKDNGYTLVVATNFDEISRKEQIKMMGWEHYFSEVYGGQSESFKEFSKLAVLQEMRRRTGYHPSQIVIMEDSPTAIKLAVDGGFSAVAIAKNQELAQLHKKAGANVIVHKDYRNSGEVLKALNGSSPINSFQKGGIDFNRKHLNLQIKRDGNGVPLPLPQQPIEDMNIDGFLPVIINISPVNIPLLLGFFDNENRPIDIGQNASDDPAVHKKRFNFSDTVKGRYAKAF